MLISSKKNREEKSVILYKNSLERRDLIRVKSEK
jgi:hypothetical protein